MYMNVLLTRWQEDISITASIVTNTKKLSKEPGNIQCKTNEMQMKQKGRGRSHSIAMKDAFPRHASHLYALEGYPTHLYWTSTTGRVMRIDS
jgi:hypothetical protein